MQQEQMDSDESDKDFGFNAQNPEEEDVQIDSAELDSASDVEKNPDNHDQDDKSADNEMPARQLTKKKKERRPERNDNRLPPHQDRKRKRPLINLFQKHQRPNKNIKQNYLLHLKKG